MKKATFFEWIFINDRIWCFIYAFFITILIHAHTHTHTHKKKKKKRPLSLFINLGTDFDIAAML
jgi:hypothetical protein